MNMRARLGIALFTGLFLGVLIIGSTAFFPANQYSAVESLPRSVIMFVSTSASTSTTSSTAAGVPGSLNSSFSNETSLATTSKTTPGPMNAAISPGSAVPASQVRNIARQPPILTLVVLLPVLAAVFFGLILYRVSVVREQEEPPTTT